MVSIALVMKIGVTGVYVGTLVSGILANLIRPKIIYRVCFEKKAGVYFRDSLKYMGVVLAVGAVITPIRKAVMGGATVLTFALMVILITLLYNLVFLAVFHRTEEFSYLWNAVTARKK